jgi:alanyl-tRNA synthetase
MKEIKPTKSWEIKKAFIEYFQNLNHTEVASSSLVPANDPSLLFTNAGMVQFKDVFLGREVRPYKRATSIQRCFRANDLENVGITPRHHTLFEMLGNFSFGDYFKNGAILYAWNFLTQVLKIPKEKLWVTVHKKDEESAKIWRDEIKVPAERIGYCGDQDNFWAMGETGPCGFCSEIYYDHGEKFLGTPPGSEVLNQGERYVEIWNLVFMQFERDSKGNLYPLPKPSVDTGMGFERIAAVQQGVHDNYLTEDFVTIIKPFEKIVAKHGVSLKGSELGNADLSVAKRILADHIRAIVFLLADGVLPANEGRGYVLRSILRRALYHLYLVGVREPCLTDFADIFVNGVGKDYYPEIKLLEKLPEIKKEILAEEIKFLETLDRGVKILEAEIAKLSGKVIPGEIVFNLHDTYGFPVILTAEIAKKNNLSVDSVGFEALMEKQRQRSRAASKFTGPENLKLTIQGASNFVGYDIETSESKILGLFASDGMPVDALKIDEEGILVLEKTPFYAESGGQVGDTGEITTKSMRFLVSDTKKYGNFHLHYGKVVAGVLSDKDIVHAKIDVLRRKAIKLNHTSAHLLHKGLQLILGPKAEQRGSLVTPSRLRFDYAHNAPLTRDEITSIEKIVNEKIRDNLKVTTEIKTLAEAKASGAKALFGEKYGDQVRVITVDDFSKELCGGTHVQQTGEIGVFKIVVETAIASGVRRIEAVTGARAFDLFTQDEIELKNAAELIKANRDQLLEKLKQLLEEKRLLDKECLRFKTELAKDQITDFLDQAITLGDIKVLATKIDVPDIETLRQSMDALKTKLKNAVILLAATNDQKIQLISGVTKNLSEKFNANLLLQYVAKQVDGKGGGRAEMAQGSGTNIALLDQALNSVVTWVKAKISE